MQARQFRSQNLALRCRLSGLAHRLGYDRLWGASGRPLVRLLQKMVQRGRRLRPDHNGYDQATQQKGETNATMPADQPRFEMVKQLIREIPDMPHL